MQKNTIKRTALRMLPFLLVCLLVFFVVPIISIATDSFDTGFLMIMLLVFFPVICFVVSSVYGFFNAFRAIQLLFPVFVGILFLATLFIFYNATGLIYVAVYASISLVGMLLGNLAHFGAEKIWPGIWQERGSDKTSGNEEKAEETLSKGQEKKPVNKKAQRKARKKALKNAMRNSEKKPG